EAHDVPGTGGAGADGQEGQAAALFRGSIRQARLAHAGRAAARRSGLLGLLEVDRRVGVVIAANFIAVAARMSLVTFLGIYFVRVAGISLATVGAAFLLESVLRGLAAPLFGAWSDRIGRRPLLLAA